MNQQVITYTTAGFMARAVATGLFVSTVTIQAPPTTLDATGAPTGPYVNVSGLVAIQCMDAPDNLGSSLSAWEKNEMPQVESFAKRHILLKQYYASLSPSTNWGDLGWRAVVRHTVTGETQTYDLRGAEADSQQTQTRLCLRAVNT